MVAPCDHDAEALGNSKLRGPSGGRSLGSIPGPRFFSFYPNSYSIYVKTGDNILNEPRVV